MLREAKFIPDFVLDAAQFCFEWGLFLFLCLLISSFIVVCSMGLIALVRGIYREVFPSRKQRYL